MVHNEVRQRFRTEGRRVSLARSRPVTVADYLVSWLEGRQSLRPSTRLAYEVHLRRYLIPHLGNGPLASLTVDAVEEMYREIAATGDVEAATVRRIHATLMTALSAAVRRGALSSNPARFAELPVAVRPRMQVWTAQQLALFLDSASLDRLHPLYALLAVTGLRRGEAIGLRWQDVDLDRGLIRVEQQIVAVAGATHVGPPKSARGRRTVAVPPRLVEELRWWSAQQRLERWSAGSDWIDTGLVFTTSLGRSLNPALVSRRFDRLVTAAALPAIRLHDLRHTSASLGLDSGESLLEVSRRLGHSSIAITADVYSHVAATTARTSADRLEKFIAVNTVHRPATHHAEPNSPQ
jgi:integrase